MIGPIVWLARSLGDRSSISWRLFASFAALVFATVAAIGSITYVFFSRTYGERLQEITARVLENVRQSVDVSLVEATEKIAIDLGMATSRNDNIQFLLDNPVQGHESMIYSIHKTLSDVAATHAGMVERIGIYYPASALTISNLTVTYLDSLGDRSSPRDLSWLHYYEELGPNRAWIEPEMVPSCEGVGIGQTGVVSYLNSLPYFARGSSRKGLLVVRVRLDYLKKLVDRSTIANAGEIVVLDGRGRLLASRTDPEAVDPDTSARLAPILDSVDMGVPLQRIDRGDESYLVLLERSNVNDWSYISLVPDSLLLRQSVVLRGTIALICVVAAFVAMPLALFLVMRLFDPVSKLIASLKRFYGAGGASREGSMVPDSVLIQDVRRYFEKESDNYDRIIREHGDVVVADLLENTLSGLCHDEAELRQRLSLLGLGFRHAWFYVVSARFAGYDDHGRFPELQHRHIISIINQVGPPELSFYALSHRRNLVVIVNAVSEDTSSVGKLWDLVDSFCRGEGVRESYCGVGSVRTALCEIGESLREADEAVEEYFLYYPQKRVFTYEETAAMRRRRYMLEREELELYRTLARTQRKAEFAKRISALVASMREEGVSSCDSETALDSILLAVSDVVSTLGSQINALLGYDAIRHASTLKRAELRAEWYVEIVDRIGVMIREQQGPGLIARTKDHIRANISHDLSLQKVADDAGLSYTYLSDLFRRTAGTTFIDFVTQTRMEVGRDLLRDTHFTVAEISAKIGYANPSYFIRKFREHFGFSPSQYRRHLIQVT